MSSNGDGNGSDNGDGGGGPGRREVAWRLFAAEFDDATLEHSQSDEERAPNYVVTPTGARVNRLFVVGVLTEVEAVSDDVLRARVVDPTGAFVVYGGQYQPEAMAFLENATTPQFVAVTGKARTFQPEDSDIVYTSIRPESINAVDAATRDRWTVQTAEQTLARVATFDQALRLGQTGEALEAALRDQGVDAGLAAGVPLAMDHYGTTRSYLAALHDTALDATRVVAGEIDADEVATLALDPDEGGDDVDVDLGAPVELDAPGEAAGTAESATAAETADAAGTEPESAEPGAGAEAEAETEPPAADDAGAADDLTDSADAEVETVEDAEDAAERGVPTESAPEVEPEQETVADEEFEPEGDDEPDLGTGDPASEMYEIDEEERREIEEEYGTEFSTGAEIGDPGEADLQPDSTTEEEPPSESEAEPEPELRDEETAAEGGLDEETTAELEAEPDEPEAAAEAAPEPEPDADEPAAAEAAEPEATDEGAEPADDAAGGGKPEPDDLNAVLMEYMHELDDGDGAEHDALVAAVTDEYDVSAAAVEDAIQDALLSGQCYEADDDQFKPI